MNEIGRNKFYLEKVRAFVLDGDPAIKYIPKEAEIVKGDLCDIDSLENFFKAPEGTETIVRQLLIMTEPSSWTLNLRMLISIAA